MSFFSKSKGGDSSTSNTTNNYSYSSSISDFLGTNKSILNLGAGSSTIYTNSLTNSYTTKNDNLADLTGGAGGEAGRTSFSAQVDAAASIAAGDGSQSGSVSKQGGGFKDSPLTTAFGGSATNGVSPLLLAGIGGAVLLVVLFLKRRR